MIFGRLFNRHAVRRKLLVTGCARSGTLYTTMALRALGLDVRHERPIWPNGRMGRDGMVSWYMAVDDPRPPHGPGAPGFVFDFILHQTRDPLTVIPSVAQFILRYPRVRRYVERNLPGLCRPDDARLPQQERLMAEAARYWLRWNLCAEKKADARVAVERLGAYLPELCAVLGVEYRPEAIAAIPADVNRRRRYVKREQPWILTWNELERIDAPACMQVRELAVKYGY